MFKRTLMTHRKRLGMSQDDLADKTGLNVRSIRELESGRARTPRPTSVRLLADAFGLQGRERERFFRQANGLAGPVDDGPRDAVPAQLPTAARLFTGRTAQISALDGLLAGLPKPGESLIITVTGGAGVGKTALAVHWAHRVREQFPDGQLYVDFRGSGRGSESSTLDALHQCIRSLGGGPEHLPPDLGAAATAYRSALAERRVLIMLDNVADPAQVRPMLSGSGSCLTVITSRNRLAGLVAVDGAHEIELDVLDPAEALTLLGGLVGDDRVAGEPCAAAELTELCSRLPLALRIVAANLTSRPFDTLTEHAHRLRAGNRLAYLEIAGDDRSSVRRAFQVSYHDLTEPARAMFRCLGLLDGDEVTVLAAAALTGTAVTAAVATLDELAAAHLIRLGVPGRYTVHELLRLYAAECLEADDPRTRAAARQRLIGYHVGVANPATRQTFARILRLPATSADVKLPVNRRSTPWPAADLVTRIDRANGNSIRASAQGGEENETTPMA